MLLSYREFAPALTAPFDLAPTAAVIGRTTAGPRLTLRAYATVRADGESIRIGANAWFGERATVHIADSERGTVIGDDITVGRYGIVHACTAGDGVVVADAAAVMDAAVIGPHALIAPGAIVPPRKTLAGGFVYEGNPAQRTRAIASDELAAAAAALRRGEPVPGFAPVALPPLDVASSLVLLDASTGPPNSPARGAPRIGRAYVAPTSAIIGDVTLADDAGVYFGCMLDAGDARIVLGACSNIQDNSLLLADRARGDLIIGERVTFGHNVRMSSGEIGDEALVGMMSIVGERVVVERGGCIAAGAWVEPGTVVRAGWIWAGRPARAFRELKPKEREYFARGVDVYVGYGRAYLAAAG
jgi:carbonic anhydrase/acetyltransferase-like protein (isoleucine patch superfamily)